MKITTPLALLLALPLFLAACGSAPSNNKEITLIPTIPMAQKNAPMASPKYDTPVQRAALAPYLNPQNALFTHRRFYFASNSAAIKPEFAEQLEIHGKYLAGNPQITITVEGSADERGSSQSNFMLGKNRAMAVAKSLKAFGVADRQMQITSIGNEQPKPAGHQESAWAMNRRVELIYPGQ